MENDAMTIMVNDEDGNEVEFRVITKLDIEDNEYVIVVPEDEKDYDEAVVLRIDKDSEGNDVLVTVDDDEFNMVQEAYYTLFDDE
ncbi:DUF1292 domain-containing protein [Clostridium fermenticellae]|uniref:UPF0473 protein D4Z93_06190 n=1 Tax=Clostridium fermenticellae TaxID=2068654 RepID=A0A386H331_9CLOT|nr:DUF1292 domain-containing protein [Clostridium fermenticellae]AYD40127.1 DUF1292 domain-containing protein [Clostridium fermenticellae]